MGQMKLDWKGVFPAIVTPFNSQGEIDESGFRRLIEYEIENGMQGIVVCGGGGEYWALTAEERRRLFRIAQETVSGRIKVIAGTSSACTKEALEMTQAAKELGCDGVLLEPPGYYWTPSRREIVEYFKEFCKFNLPIIAYNYPVHSGVNITPDLYSELAELPWVSAIKESSQKFGQVIECVKLVGDRLVIFAGFSVMLGAASVLTGADGYICTEPNFVPQMTRDLYKLSAERKIDEALDLQFRMIDLYYTVFHRPDAYQAVLKAAMNLLGLPGGIPRLPISPMSEEGIKDLRSVLERLGQPVV